MLLVYEHVAVYLCGLNLDQACVSCDNHMLLVYEHVAVYL